MHDLLFTINSIGSGMLTHNTINPGLLIRYTLTIAYHLQRKQTNYELMFQYLYQYYSPRNKIFINTED